MKGMEVQPRTAIASPAEDPNVTIVSSSPPCFLHELDPVWLGYLGRDEVSALLDDLLAAAWFGTVLERAWLRAMLRRHLACLDARLGHAAQRPGANAWTRGGTGDRGTGDRGTGGDGLGDRGTGGIGTGGIGGDGDTEGEGGDARRDRLAGRLREALPRLHDDALHRDLRDLLWIVERDLGRRHDLARSA